jgi:uncharacterized protein (UPF0332 family)
MSINNIQSYSTDAKEIYADYKFGDTFYRDKAPANQIPPRLAGLLPNASDYSFRTDYYIPLDSVKQQILNSENILAATKDNIENNLLRKIYINPYLDPDLEESHFRIWDEASLLMDIPDTKELPTVHISSENNLEKMPVIVNDPNLISKNNPPRYICFDEYLFAERHLSTAGRRLVNEYDQAVAQATFSYFYQLRKLLNLFLNEISYIKNSLLLDFGDEYENPTQQQIALQYDTWGKIAVHYSQRIAKTIVSKPGEIPNAELDKISKKQAAQFQAFFAIRLNAVDAEINDQIASLKRDLIDNCEIFYSRFVSPSLRISKDISNPLEFDYLTTKFSKDNPILSGELIVATNLIKGNFASIHADCMQRFEMMSARVDSMMSLIHEKRKYANYISQLGNKSVQKRQVLLTVENDLYSILFKNIYSNTNRNNTFLSNHSKLDGLLNDDHPQYLLKDKGNITGDIFVKEGITIDGVDLSEHAHTGSDGSHRIKSTDIDYDNIRALNAIENTYAVKPLSVTVDGFIADIITGGIPVFDTVISIEVNNETLNTHEYEILYTEVI